MRQVIRDFKEIMTDKRERNEFIESFICVICAIILVYMLIVIFH